MQPVSASLVLEHPLHSDFIPHAPLKKKAAAAIVSGTYLIVHNVKRTMSKVHESAKTRKTQSPKHTHTHTREPRVYFYNASKNTASLHPTPNEEEQKNQKAQKNSRCINARWVTALLDPIDNATIERANKKTEQNRTNKQTNATRQIPKRSNLRITTTAMHNYFTIADSTPHSSAQKTKVPIKQSSKRKSVQQNALKLLVVLLLPLKKKKENKQTTPPTPPRPQNKKQNKKTIKSEQKNGRQTKRKRTK
jgi:hypothetical protein